MLASLIASFASGEVMNVVRRAKSAAIAYLLASVFALVGIGFLIGALFTWAARRFGTIEAAIGFGVAFFLIAIVVLLVHSIASRSRARRTRRRSVDLATVAGVAAVSVLPVLLKSRAGLVAPLVALAAYAIYRENRKDKPGGDKRDD
jgi:ABC-type uncharacterized transport system permease subunit